MELFERGSVCSEVHDQPHPGGFEDDGLGLSVWFSSCYPNMVVFLVIPFKPTLQRPSKKHTKRDKSCGHVIVFDPAVIPSQK